MGPMIRLGVLGTAKIVRRAILPALGLSASVQLVAVASRTLERAKALADEAGGVQAHARAAKVRAFGSYAELLADPEIDAVYVPLVNDLHHLGVLESAWHGKHVLCEKPLALNADEAEEMAAACEERGVVLMEAFMWRHHPRVRLAKQLIAEGAIGKLVHVETGFAFPADRVEDGWLFDRAHGGGALMDIGCYGVDAGRFFCAGEPTVTRAWGRFDEADGVDLAMEAELVFAGGERVTISAGIAEPDRNELILHGTHGRLEFPEAYLPGRESVLHLEQRGSRRVLPVPEGDAYAAELDGFAESIHAGGLLFPAENGVANARVMDAIRSSWSGK